MMGFKLGLFFFLCLLCNAQDMQGHYKDIQEVVEVVEKDQEEDMPGVVEEVFEEDQEEDMPGIAEEVFEEDQEEDMPGIAEEVFEEDQIEDGMDENMEDDISSQNGAAEDPFSPLRKPCEDRRDVNSCSGVCHWCQSPFEKEGKCLPNKKENDIDCPGLTQEADPCELPKDSGTCFAFQTKFYFDKNDKKCKMFTYGGCSGNENRFDTIEECDQRCGSPPELGQEVHPEKGSEEGSPPELGQEVHPEKGSEEVIPPEEELTL